MTNSEIKLTSALETETIYTMQRGINHPRLADYLGPYLDPKITFHNCEEKNASPPVLYQMKPLSAHKHHRLRYKIT